MKITTVSVFVLLAVSLVAYGKEQTGFQSDDPYNMYWEAYQAGHEHIIDDLNKAKKRSREIARFATKYNELTRQLNAIRHQQDKKKSQAANLSNDRATLYNTFKQDFPILSGINLFDLNNKGGSAYIIDPGTISDVLNEQIDIYKKSGADACFSNKSYVETKECDIFKNYCSDIWGYGIENGKLYYKEFDGNYEVVDMSVESLETDTRYDLNSDIELLNGPLIRNKDSQLFCKLLSYSSEPLKPKFVGHHFDPFRDIPYEIDPAPKAIDARCIKIQPTEKAVDNLIRYHETYPEDHSASIALNKYERWVKTCQHEVENLCKNTSVARERVTVSYVTDDCKIRDATDQDLKKDMRSFDTEAQRLHYAALLDVMEVCQKASNADYYWDYERPVLDDECKDRN